MMSKDKRPSEPFVTGQVWEMAESSVLIGQVGKMLVSYKHLKKKQKFAVPTLLGAKQELQKYLNENKAVLV